MDQFNRKWNNLTITGTTLSPPMFVDFVPGWPEAPVNVSPQNAALGVTGSVPLRWEGGWWAHKYDIYFGTTNPPTTLIAQNYMPGSATAGVSSTKESYNPCSPPAGFESACPTGLAPNTTYYWRVRGKTMVGDGGGPFNAPARAVWGPVWSFTTVGTDPVPAAPGGLVATSVSSTRIDLTWNDVAGETGYKIERKLASASTTAWAQIATTGANVVTYQNSSGLTPNTSYQYRVRAWTSAGNSGYSNTASAATLPTSPATGRILADAYVRAGQFASTNYGTATELITKYSVDTQYRREAYLKLDISAVQAGDTVRLRLSGKLPDTRATSVTTSIFAVANTSWTETGLNWSNKPAASGAAVATLAVSGTSARWYEADLTDHVQARRAAGASIITIALVGLVDTPPYTSFASRESTSRPELVIGTSAPSTAAGVVEDAVRARWVIRVDELRLGVGAGRQIHNATAVLRQGSVSEAGYQRRRSRPGDTVRLRLYGRLSDTRSPSVTTQIRPVANTSWNEEA